MGKNLIESDEKWLHHALRLAECARAQNEVPVGAVVVKEDLLLGEGYNRPISTHDPSAHAEMVALRAAAKALGNYRLLGATLYVTLEPCLMCAGALLHARVARVVFGTSDPRAGALGSVCNVNDFPSLNHRLQVERDQLIAPCKHILQEFFKERRK